MCRSPSCHLYYYYYSDYFLILSVVLLPLTFPQLAPTPIIPQSPSLRGKFTGVLILSYFFMVGGCRSPDGVRWLEGFLSFCDCPNLASCLQTCQGRTALVFPTSRCTEICSLFQPGEPKGQLPFLHLSLGRAQSRGWGHCHPGLILPWRPPPRDLVVSPFPRPLGGHVLSRAWRGLSGGRPGQEGGQWLVCLRERSGLLMGPRGAVGRRPSSQLGIQSLKENTSRALGFQTVALRMKVNMVIYPLKFEIWIEEHEI